jgi:hypothetical protein
MLKKLFNCKKQDRFTYLIFVGAIFPVPDRANGKNNFQVREKRLQNIQLV